MKKDSTPKIILVFIVLLLIFNISFAVYVLQIRNSILQVTTNFQDNILPDKNQIINLKFSRNPNLEYLKSIIKLSQNNIQIQTSEYSLTKSENVVSINFNENLSGEKLTVEFKNPQSNFTSLDKDYSLNFTIQPQNLYYLKNAVPEISRSSVDNSIIKKYSTKDQIIELSPDFKSENVILEDDRIYKYVKKDNWVVYITNVSEDEQALKFYNISTKTTTKLTLTKHKYDYLSFNPGNSNEFVVGIQNRIQTAAGYTTSDGYRINIFTYDSASKSWVAKEINPKNTALDIHDIAYDNDGKSLMFRATTDDYYLLELSKLDNPNLITLGKHFDTGGFSRSNRLLSFNDYGLNSEFQTLTILDSEKDTYTINQSNPTSLIDSHFFHSSDILIASKFQNDLEFSKGIYSPDIFKLKNNEKVFEEADLIDYKQFDKKVSYENPTVSYDDKLIAFETFTVDDLQNATDDERIFGSLLKPQFGKIQIYDLNSKSFLKFLFPGIYPQWD